MGRNSKTNNPSCPGFELVRDFIHVHLNCKFHEDPIKTECVILVPMSNRDVFSNLEDVTLRLIIRSGQFRSAISAMSSLSVSFRKIRSKLNELR